MRVGHPEGTAQCGREPDLVFREHWEIAGDGVRRHARIVHGNELSKSKRISPYVSCRKVVVGCGRTVTAIRGDADEIHRTRSRLDPLAKLARLYQPNVSLTVIKMSLRNVIS